MSKVLKAGSPKVRSGSGEWTSLTAGAQDLPWEPSRKAGAGQGREGLGKLVKEFELPMHFAEQTRGTWGVLSTSGREGRDPACFSPI